MFLSYLHNSISRAFGQTISEFNYELKCDATKYKITTELRNKAFNKNNKPQFQYLDRFLN